MNNNIIDVTPVGEKPKRHRRTKQEMLQQMALNQTNFDDVNTLDDEYHELIKTDKKYSLEIDPDNKYNMSEDQKTFIRHYIDSKNLMRACQLSNFIGFDKDNNPYIDTVKGIKYLNEYSTQQEIRRINIALKARQFSTKMLGINEVGSYLSSLLTEENLAEHDRLSPKDKLTAAKMIVDLNILKKNAMDNPNVIDVIDVEENIKNLSVKSIKQLIASSHDTKKQNEKEEIIDQINEDDLLTAEEIDTLRGMSKDELLAILEDINRKD